LGSNRPVDQRIKGQFVLGRIDTDRVARFKRGLVHQREAEAAQPGLADIVGLSAAVMT
jgi:hypothetical protein